MEKFKIVIDENNKLHVWMQGKEVSGIRSIEFEWDIESFAIHRIEFLSHMGGIDAKTID